MITFAYLTRVGAAATAAALTAMTLGACSTASLESFATGKQNLNGPATFIETDPGPAATDLAGFATATMAAITTTLRGGGEVFASPITANSAAEPWAITAQQENDKQVPGSAALSADARGHAAATFAPAVTKMLQTPHPGADVLSAIQRAVYTARGLPHAMPKVLVLLLNGEIQANGIDTVAHPPLTLGDRERLIGTLLATRQVTGLNQFRAIYLGGVGVGVPDVAAARSLVSLWADLIRKAGGRLISVDSVLHLPASLA